VEEDQEAEWPAQEDGDELERDDGWVRMRPSNVGLPILAPERGGPVVPGGSRSAVQTGPEEGALEDEVGQAVECQPDEDEPALRGGQMPGNDGREGVGREEEGKDTWTRLSDCGSAAEIRRTAQTRECGRLQDGLGASGLKHGAALTSPTFQRGHCES
jgi:hypothetical protein